MMGSGVNFNNPVRGKLEDHTGRVSGAMVDITGEMTNAPLSSQDGVLNRWRETV